MALKMPNERAIANLLFWCLVVPIVAGVFLRLFFVLFNFGIGLVVLPVLGQAFAGLVTGAAFLIALGFTVGVLIWVYTQYQKHILATL